MCKFVNNTKHSRIDKCLRNLIDTIRVPMKKTQGAEIVGEEKRMVKNKRGQITAVLTPQAIATIIGGVLGYLIAPQLGQDRVLGIVIGGILGLIGILTLNIAEILAKVKN